MTDEFTLTVQCEDRAGIVYGISKLIAEAECFITRSRSFGDPDTCRFFMRLQFRPLSLDFHESDFQRKFASLADAQEFEWSLSRTSEKMRMVIMVSRTDHCANALLYGARINDLPVIPTAIISNHADLKNGLVHWGVPFHHVPVTPDGKAEAEEEMLRIVDETRSDLVVLARYMQVFSEGACEKLYGRCINIHHAFLPGFKGAKPYHRAHARGVKMIGATAHFVTPDLDEGPIITQVTESVTHGDSIDTLISVGRGLEATALTRAVKAYAERRVFLNGEKTVVFP